MIVIEPKHVGAVFM